MVSPQDKNGASGFYVREGSEEPAFEGGSPTIIGGGGERVLFGADAAFAGAAIGTANAYLTIRTGTGWHTVPVTPPSELAHPGVLFGGFAQSLDGNAELSRVVFGTEYNEAYPSLVASQYQLSTSLLPAPAEVAPGKAEAVPGVTGQQYVSYAAMSEDGNRIVFTTAARILKEAAPGIPFGAQDVNLYERDLAAQATRVVDIVPGGTTAFPAGAHIGGPKQYTPLVLGLGFANQESRGAVSRDGSRVAFTAAPTKGAGSLGLYLRVNAQDAPAEGRTLEVSSSEDPLGRAPSLGAQYQWMTPDGAHVFFRDDGQLLAGAASAEPGLYRYDVNEAGDAGSLALVSQQLGGAMGLVGASQDGQVAYFVSKSALAGSGAVEGQPNLYVNDHGSVSFVATLSYRDPVMLAARFNPENPYEVTLAPAEAEKRERSTEARVTPDGRFLVFQSHAQLTGFDNAGHGEIYEYTLGAPGVRCISCGPVEPAQRDAQLSYREGTTFLHLPLNITPNGEWVFFESEEPLTSQADAGRWGVYQYHGGRVALVSGGGTGNSRFLGASESGRDVFFTSFAKLVPQDTDTSGDIYDARIGGGFPSPPPAAGEGCADSECQGPPAEIVSPVAPASMTQAGEESPASNEQSHRKARQRKRHKRHRRGVHARKHRRGTRRGR